MSVDNVLMLRVGVDSNTGKAHGPLYEDNTFDYIPIPEESDSEEERQYSQLPSRGGGKLSKIVPHLSDAVPHFDPEFQTYTYGDPGSNKRSQLTRLSSGDILIFYSSLTPKDIDIGPRLCAVGYFTVEQVFDFEEMFPAEREVAFNEVPNNAHVKRKGLTSESPHRDHFPAIVKGRPEESRLFDKARPLGDSNRKVLPWVADIIGFKGDLTRAGVARVLDEANATEILEWLEQGSDLLVADDSHLRSYVVTTDTGFAPNVSGGYCTLATCKPRVRKHAQIGDWVLGTPKKADGQAGIVQLMRVDEAMTFDEYYRDRRFDAKKPENDPNGDNIYYREDDILVQDKETNHHADPENRKRDLGTNRVLISDTFWYFGGSDVTIPEGLRYEVIHKYDSSNRRLYSKRNNQALKELVYWLSLRFDLGVQGQPSIGASSDEKYKPGTGC